MCPYKFALESCVQGKTIFRNRFLIIWYMKVLLQSNVILRLQSERPSVERLKQIMEDEYQSLDDMVKIANELEKTQIISGVYSTIADKLRKQESVFETPDIKKMREEFLAAKTKSYQSGEPLDFDSIIRRTIRYYLSFNDDCMYCASKDVCLHARFE